MAEHREGHISRVGKPGTRASVKSAEWAPSPAQGTFGSRVFGIALRNLSDW